VYVNYDTEDNKLCFKKVEGEDFSKVLEGTKHRAAD